MHPRVQSNYGSEWLHVAILETKLAMAKDPAWLRSHSVLMLTDTMENAAAIYELALRYGTPRSKLARQRLAHARQVIKSAKK